MISRDSALFFVGGIEARAGRSLVERANFQVGLLARDFETNSRLPCCASITSPQNTSPRSLFRHELLECEEQHRPVVPSSPFELRPAQRLDSRHQDGFPRHPGPFVLSSETVQNIQHVLFSPSIIQQIDTKEGPSSAHRKPRNPSSPKCLGIVHKRSVAPQSDICEGLAWRGCNWIFQDGRA